MNRSRKAFALLLLAGLVSLDAGLFAEAERRPRYSRRLDPPMRHETFRKPRSVTADLHTGEVFVCDSLGQRIAIFDDRGVFRYQIQAGSTFRTPLDVAVDPEGYLYLVAYHQAVPSVLRLDFDGTFLGLVELSGLPELEYPFNPMSVALSPSGQRLYVLDAANHRVFISDPEGRVETTIDLVEGMDPEDAVEQIYAHVDVYADTVLVARPTLGVVHLFDLDGTPRGQVGRFGTANCQTAFPMAAGLDDQGHVMIVDQRRMMFTLWDRETNRCLDEFYGRGGHPGGLYAPEDLALDRKGRVYIAQTFDGRVQVYDGGWPAAGTPPPVPPPAPAE